MPFTSKFKRIDLGASTTSPDIVPYDWQLRLVSGREIRLVRMSQHQTYGGMLNGLPSEPEEKVLQAVADANEWDCNFHKRPAVLPAAIVSGTRIAPEGQVHRDRWIEPKKWEMLPVVTCFGVFESSQRQGGFEDFSSSLVIWFQGHFGIPADAGTLVAFSLLDWDRHAEECNW